MRYPGIALIVPTLACLALTACGGSSREAAPAPVREPVKSTEPTPMEQLANLDRTQDIGAAAGPETEALRAEIAKRSGFDGDVIMNYPEGGIELEANYEGGVKHGEWKKYHANGQIFEQGAFVGGEKNGLWVTFYPSGQKLEEGEYENGDAIGIHRAWLADGTQIVERDWSRGR
jgi:hypothetical protein